MLENKVHSLLDKYDWLVIAITVSATLLPKWMKLQFLIGFYYLATC
jgi:hypothetical protein